MLHSSLLYSLIVSVFMFAWGIQAAPASNLCAVLEQWPTPVGVEPNHGPIPETYYRDKYEALHAAMVADPDSPCNTIGMRNQLGITAMLGGLYQEAAFVFDDLMQHAQTNRRPALAINAATVYSQAGRFRDALNGIEVLLCHFRHQGRGIKLEDRRVGLTLLGRWFRACRMHPDIDPELILMPSIELTANPDLWDTSNAELTAMRFEWWIYASGMLHAVPGLDECIQAGTLQALAKFYEPERWHPVLRERALEVTSATWAASRPDLTSQLPWVRAKQWHALWASASPADYGTFSCDILEDWASEARRDSLGRKCAYQWIAHLITSRAVTTAQCERLVEVTTRLRAYEDEELYNDVHLARIERALSWFSPEMAQRAEETIAQQY